MSCDANSRVIDMVGVKFGNVTGVRKVGSSKSRDAKWEFACRCGSRFVTTGYSVRSGRQTSCPACSKKRCALASTTHGQASSSEYGIWNDMKTRCHNSNSTNYSNYGGRGISVCKRWRYSFEAFLRDMGPRPSGNHSIDRIDNNGNYHPKNCRWATTKEQARNKRNNRKIKISGQVKTLAEWAEHAGVTPSCILSRIKSGKSGAALIAPARAGAVTFNGITDTYDGWSKRTGLKPSTIAMRITQYQWPVSKALTKGASRCA